MEDVLNQYAYGKPIKYLFYSFPLVANYMLYNYSSHNYIYWLIILLYILYITLTAYFLYIKFNKKSSEYDKQLFDSMDNLDRFRDYVTRKYKDVKKLQDVYYYVCEVIN
jgi:hypothetical protein